jgi:hypothetical protein
MQLFQVQLLLAQAQAQVLVPVQLALQLVALVQLPLLLLLHHNDMNVTCGTYSCPVLLNSTCVFYEGANLIYINVNSNDNIQTALEKVNDKVRELEERLRILES